MNTITDLVIVTDEVPQDAANTVELSLVELDMVGGGNAISTNL